MGHGLGARTQLEHGENLGARVDGQPQPEHLCTAAQSCSQFIQLHVRELKVAEAVLVQGLCMFPSTSQPGADGGLSVAEDPFGGRRVEPFGQRREDHGNLLRRGFHSIQGSIASSTERAAAGRTSKGLDALGLAMRAIAHQSMDGSISDAEVQAPLIGAGEPFRVYPLGRSPAAFHLRPRTRHLWALTLQPTKEWSRDDRKGSQAGYVA